MTCAGRLFGAGELQKAAVRIGGLCPTPCPPLVYLPTPAAPLTCGERRICLLTWGALRVAAAIASGWLVSGGIAAAEDHHSKLPFPDVVDISHGTTQAEKIFDGFFTAKSLHDGVKMVSFFGPDPVLYIDADLGMTWPSRAALLQVWTNPPFSTAPTGALSYPLRVVGDEHSAVIEFVDTPTLLGSEFRFLSSVTFDDKRRICVGQDHAGGASASEYILGRRRCGRDTAVRA